MTGPSGFYFSLDLLLPKVFARASNSQVRADTSSQACLPPSETPEHARGPIENVFQAMCEKTEEIDALLSGDLQDWTRQRQDGSIKVILNADYPLNK